MEKIDSLKLEFQRALEMAAREAKKDVNYYPAYFWQMLKDYGGHRTAQLLLDKKTVSEGFVKLWLAERPDLTVESIILEQKWHELFRIPKERLQKDV